MAYHEWFLAILESGQSIRVRLVFGEERFVGF